MKRRKVERINLWVEESLYSQIKQQADSAYLKIATYTRQLIQLALKNNPDDKYLHKTSNFKNIIP